jgi:hypothetical protein
VSWSNLLVSSTIVCSDMLLIFCTASCGLHPDFGWVVNCHSGFGESEDQILSLLNIHCLDKEVGYEVTCRRARTPWLPLQCAVPGPHVTRRGQSTGARRWTAHRASGGGTPTTFPKILISLSLPGSAHGST